VRAFNTKVVGLIPAKTLKIENLNLHGFELHRPSRKGIKLLFEVIKAIINQIGPGCAVATGSSCQDAGHGNGQGPRACCGSFKCFVPL